MVATCSSLRGGTQFGWSWYPIYIMVSRWCSTKIVKTYMITHWFPSLSAPFSQLFPIQGWIHRHSYFLLDHVDWRQASGATGAIFELPHPNSRAGVPEAMIVLFCQLVWATCHLGSHHRLGVPPRESSSPWECHLSSHHPFFVHVKDKWCRLKHPFMASKHATKHTQAPFNPPSPTKQRALF